MLTDDNYQSNCSGEELGAVIKLFSENVAALMHLAEEFSVADMLSLVGQSSEETVCIKRQRSWVMILYALAITELRKAWTQVHGYQIARRRDNPACVQQGMT
jgi:phosphoribosylformylglycinamidine synthase